MNNGQDPDEIGNELGYNDPMMQALKDEMDRDLDAFFKLPGE